MKDEKKVNTTEEVKEEVKLEENGVELTDEELAQVNAGGFDIVINPGSGDLDYLIK